MWSYKYSVVCILMPHLVLFLVKYKASFDSWFWDISGETFDLESLGELHLSRYNGFFCPYVPYTTFISLYLAFLLSLFLNCTLLNPLSLSQFHAPRSSLKLLLGIIIRQIITVNDNYDSNLSYLWKNLLFFQKRKKITSYYGTLCMLLKCKK